ncbi:MAG: hypothetical protein KF691_14400 [Phycisphaeraceae bacterium]|nr:hypothetical protein [Phycisphaeraceae bacterium]
MKTLLKLALLLSISLALSAVVTGCTCNEKCDDGDECCEGEGACCKGGGECKEGDKAKPVAGGNQQSSAPVNTTCPIGGHDADPNLTASYQGKTIAFCCDDCKQEFLGMNDKGKSEILAKATER